MQCLSVAALRFRFVVGSGEILGHSPTIEGWMSEERLQKFESQ